MRARLRNLASIASAFMLVGASFYASPAAAYSSGAWLLARANPDVEDCLVQSQTIGVRNECGEPVAVLMNLVVSASGPKTVRLIAVNNAESTSRWVICQAFSTNQTGSFESSTPRVQTTLTATPTEIRMDISRLPAFGTLNVECTLGPNAIIRSVSW